MPVPNLTLRLVKGSPLTAVEADANLSTLAGFSNGLEKRVNTSLDPVGALLPGAVTQAAVAAALAGILDGVTVGFNTALNTALSGQVVFTTNPVNNDTMTFTINATPVVVTFVTTIGVAAGNVLIGLSAQATLLNLFGLLTNPNTTGSTQVAFSAPNAAIIQLATYFLDGSVIDITNAGGLTSLNVTTTRTGNLWVPNITAKVVVLPNTVTSATTGSVNLLTQWASNTTWSVSADFLTVRSTSGASALLSGINLTGNLAVNGVGGLEYQADGVTPNVPANNTFYYLWVITNGTAPTTLLSLSATVPIMPAGYGYGALVGAVLTDGSAHFIQFMGRERKMWIKQTFFANPTSGDSGFRSLTGYVPPIAKVLIGNAGASANITTAYAIGLWAATVGGVAIGQANCMITPQNQSFDIFGTAVQYRVPVDSNQKLNWSVGGGSDVSAITITGYEW